MIDKLETWAFELNDKPNRGDMDKTIIKALTAVRDNILNILLPTYEIIFLFPISVLKHLRK